MGPARAFAQKAVVPTVQSDWSGAAHAIVDVTPSGGSRDSELDLFPTATTDWIIRSYGQYFYLIGRYYTDSLTKFSIDDPESPIYQVSVLPDGLASGNPHDMIFVHNEKAYLPLYGSDKLWVINPRTGSKIKEINLSAYSDSDGIPEMHAGVIVDGKLFLLLQRLDRNANWDPSNTAYVVVIDVSTDKEIDTTGGAGGLKGIALAGRNPGSIQYLPENHTIYIAATGKVPGVDPANPYLYTGGIYTINPDTYVVAQLIDDGPDGPGGDHPYGAFAAVTLVSANKGYLVGYEGWGDNSFRSFDPTTGVVGGAVQGLQGKSLVGNESLSGVDENGLVWVSAGELDHTVYIVDPTTDTIDEQVDTNHNPGGVVFCPQTIFNASGQANSTTGTGVFTVSSDVGTLSGVTSYHSNDFPDAAGKPAQPFVDGLIGFEITGMVPGADAQVTISFPTPRASDAEYYKIDAAGDYYKFPTDRITLVNENTIVLTLTDGGMGDRDGLANGTIEDPGGFVMTPPEDPKKPTTDGDDDDSCFISSLNK